MVAKISVGNSLYGALAYNGEKINEAKGRLLTTNRIYNDGTGTMDIHRAMEDFLALMPVQSKVEKPVVHISLNPHPDDILTDTELQDIAREYLEKMGFGNQPYLVFKHEDIDRRHLHIVTVRVDENGRSIDTRNNFYRSKQITRELERKYGLHDAERKNRRFDTPLHKVNASAGDVKKQTGNIVKALNGQYRFQTMGEYRALLSLYNMTVEEARGNVRRREYHGLVYSATDDKGNKVGNPFKSSLFGKSVGYEAVQKKFARSKQEIKDRKLADMTKRTVISVLEGTYDKEKFVSRLREKGIDVVLRYTEEGRIYGATFIDHRTGCVLNGSRMGKELSANALQEHFSALCRTAADPLSVPVETGEICADRRIPIMRTCRQCRSAHSRMSGCGCRGGSLYPGDAAQEEKRRGAGLGNVTGSINNQIFSIYVTNRRRFEGIGEKSWIFCVREYYFSVMNVYWFCYGSHTNLGHGHWRGGQNPDELQSHGGAVPFSSYTKLFAVSSCLPCPVWGQRVSRERNHLGRIWTALCRRVRVVLSQTGGYWHCRCRLKR